MLFPLIQRFYPNTYQLLHPQSISLFSRYEKLINFNFLASNSISVSSSIMEILINHTAIKFLIITSSCREEKRHKRQNERQTEESVLQIFDWSDINTIKKRYRVGIRNREPKSPVYSLLSYFRWGIPREQRETKKRNSNEKFRLH